MIFKHRYWKPEQEELDVRHFPELCPECLDLRIEGFSRSVGTPVVEEVKDGGIMHCASLVKATPFFCSSGRSWPATLKACRLSPGPGNAGRGFPSGATARASICPPL